MKNPLKKPFKKKWQNLKDKEKRGPLTTRKNPKPGKTECTIFFVDFSVRKWLCTIFFCGLFSKRRISDWFWGFTVVEGSLLSFNTHLFTVRLDFKTHDSTSSSSKDYWLYILWENLVWLLGCARVHHFLPKIFSQWRCTFIKAKNNILTWWLRSSIIFFSFRCVFLVISYFHENKKLPANLLYPQQSIFESWVCNLLYPQQRIF